VKNIQIHQIFYDDATRAGLDPGFIPLDNASNERPDWREYWPMQGFLKNNVLEEEAYYGFFSPKFQLKTGLSAAQVNEFINANDADVYIFSPYVEQSSFFLNAFDHGEANHAGLLPAMQQFVESMGIQFDLRTIVCDYDKFIFSNFFVAKSAFWREWLAVGERLFAISESSEGPFAATLNASTQYHAQVGAVGLKVFMMERLASLVLILRNYVSKAYDPFALTRTGIPVSYLDHEMRIADALKKAFLTTRDSRYMESYLKFRGVVLAGLDKN
jgi:hypothetical protein